MVDIKYTQMRIKRDTLRRLQERGKMGESYTEVLERMLDEDDKRLQQN